MSYFITKSGKIVNANNELIPMDEFNPLYQDYVNFLRANGTVEDTDFDFPIPTLALFEVYPDLQGMNPKLLSLDNLEGIKRDSTLADKGLKGEKKYRKNGVLIWSSEKKYWFQEDGYPDGFRRITKIFNLDETVADSWENFYELSEDDKEMFKKNQRELIFEYFKSQQPDLFNLLYTFFKEDIDRYVMKGGSQLAATLTDAAENHPVPQVRHTLSMEIETQSGGTVSVLEGILYELVT
jgi:hypothetical protein